ncbi:hypothetical protein [Flavobacterium aestivum]|nr:hypothetical protein [Flavobacterium aestivum]
MHTKKMPKKALRKMETIFEYDARLKKEAIEISKNFAHTKPIKY